MPLPPSNASGGNIANKELKKRIFSFFSEYIDIFQQKARERELILGSYSFGKPTDYFFFVDSKSLHCIYSSQYAGGLTNIFYNDLREPGKPRFKLKELAQWLHAERGMTDWRGLSFDFSLLEADGSSRVVAMEQRAEEQVAQEREDIIRTHQPLFISATNLDAFLNLAGEDDLTNILLVPLLRHIGFLNAESKGHRDRILEFGQDIRRMKFQLPTGHWLYFSAQVKTGDIRTQSSAQQDHVEEVLQQAYSQLNWEMPDPEIGINVTPDHVLLIISGFITEAAKQYIFRHSLIKDKRLLVLEKEALIRLCQQHGLPESVQNTILEFNKTNH